MKIFLSATENETAKRVLKRVAEILATQKPYLWNLVAFSSMCDKKWIETLRDSSRLVLVDSGAHSFQKGKKVEWEKYTRAYAEFIRQFDAPNVLGYFEMDVDNLLGYEEVLRLRSILEKTSGHPEKIIPVWHSGRGIAEFKRMCCEKSGGIVAVSGFHDIRDDQYGLFLKEAWQHGCKLHCLGMTKQSVIDRIPFDFTDSASWKLSALFGSVGGRKVSREQSKKDLTAVLAAVYLDAMDKQVKYWSKWRSVCQDDF